MRIPKINTLSYKPSKETSVVEKIDVDLLERVQYDEEIDPEDTKSFPKVIRTIKMLVRSSFEYRALMKFLKENYNMNSSFFFKGVQKTQDKKFSLEIHHTPFTLEDIVATVIMKRLLNGESLKYLDIANEIMHVHYTGDVGLVPLDKTTHALIHSESAPEVFIPLQFVPFGDFHQFYKDYKKYIPEKVKESYGYLQELSMKYDRLQDIIPRYMKPKMLYYEGFVKIDSFEELLDMVESE